MPLITFTENLQRHIACPPAEVCGVTVREALDEAFAACPKLSGYVLEDDGSVRKHISIWVAGTPLNDRQSLTDPVGERDEIYVMQALSGG